MYKPLILQIIMPSEIRLNFSLKSIFIFLCIVTVTILKDFFTTFLPTEMQNPALTEAENLLSSLYYINTSKN